MARLREVLHPLRSSGHFDYVLLDCPPSLGVLMTSALAAADELLVPLQCEYFGLEGLSKIVHVVQQIRDCGANPNLLLEGIVMTMYDSRANLSQQVVGDVKNYFAEIIYNSIIPRTVRLGEAVLANPSSSMSRTDAVPQPIERWQTSSWHDAWRSSRLVFIRIDWATRSRALDALMNSALKMLQFR